MYFEWLENFIEYISEGRTPEAGRAIENLEEEKGDGYWRKYWFSWGSDFETAYKGSGLDKRYPRKTEEEEKAEVERYLARTKVEEVDGWEEFKSSCWKDMINDKKLIFIAGCVLGCGLELFCNFLSKLI